MLFKVAGGVGRIFAGVYVFKEIFLLTPGLDREAIEAEKKQTKYSNQVYSNTTKPLFTLIFTILGVESRDSYTLRKYYNTKPYIPSLLSTFILR